MINPDNITVYNRTDDELLEFFIFCVFVAGHNSHMTAIALDKFLSKKLLWKKDESLFKAFKTYMHFEDKQVIKDLKESSIGCYTRNSNFINQAFEKIVNGNLDLRTASLEELETFIGVGPKTSRFFILHSRKRVNNIAVLDTHVLKYMKDQGIETPKSTPSGKRYRELEIQFLNLAKKSGKNLADFDLEIWKARRIK